tara:strand:+ start:129 stop:572 length:444 start_codon:yes stop_codon:yes gene_type:complete
MDLKQLRLELEEDEGIKFEVYKDHLGYPTFGIGHLITEDDEEYGKPVGYSIEKSRVVSVFENDMQGVIKDCTKLYEDFDELPEEAQRIIANMMFNMGLTRLSKFKGMKRGVDARDWDAAADEMVDSNWYKQVTNRAERLVKRMRALS